jgi:DNA-directed RNA polymerase subunit RPC12/RpoP
MVQLDLPQRLHGDFHIVLDCELLAVGSPLPEYGAGINMNLLLDSPNSANLSLVRNAQGDRFTANKVIKGPDDKNNYEGNKDAPVAQRKGKLQFKRSGTTLQYLVAEEGQDYRSLLTTEIGAEDVTMVRIWCWTYDAPILLDVRLTELTVEADRLTDDTSTPGAPDVVAGSRQWLVMALSTGLVIVLLAAGIGAVLGARRRRATAKAESPGQSPVVFPCSGCGKNLKIKAEASGKKVKCPQCGVITVVPSLPPQKPAAPAQEK